MKRRYKCDNCGFAFETEKDPRACPYCSKSSLTLVMSDDDVLQDIDSMLK